MVFSMADGDGECVVFRWRAETESMWCFDVGVRMVWFEDSVLVVFGWGFGDSVGFGDEFCGLWGCVAIFTWIGAMKRQSFPYGWGMDSVGFWGFCWLLGMCSYLLGLER